EVAPNAQSRWSLHRRRNAQVLRMGDNFLYPQIAIRKSVPPALIEGDSRRSFHFRKNLVLPSIAIEGVVKGEFQRCIPPTDRPRVATRISRTLLFSEETLVAAIEPT